MAEPVSAPRIQTSCNCTIRIADEEIRHRISSVRLDQFIDDHHVLLVRVKQVSEGARDSQLDDPSMYTGFLGKTISATIASSGGVVDTGRQMEFVGIVTDVKLENSIDGLNTVLIVGKSPTVSMDGAKQVTYFEEKAASDIIGSIVAKYAITKGNIEASGANLKYSVQYRETDYRYIMRLAESSGLFSYYNGSEYRCQAASGSSPIELAWRTTLGSFVLGLGTAPGKYSSRSWEYGTKSAVTGESDTGGLRSAPSDMSRVSIDASNSVFSQQGYVSATSATDQSSIDQAISRKVESEVGRMIRCTGESIVPEVKVGHCVKVINMGPLNGLYWVRMVTHYFDESGKYHNVFSSTPLDVAYPTRTTSWAGLTKLQSALVTDLADPEGLGRIKVKIPALGIETLWVRYMSPHAGSEHGWISLPEIDDEVLVGWENGDPDHPIAIGSLYSGKDTMPYTPDEKNDVKIFLTRAGNEIRITDTDGSEEIKICNKEGKNKIVLAMSGPSISIESEGDISIKGNSIKLEAKGAVEVKSDQGTTIDASGNLACKSGGNVDLEATGQCNVKGATINLN